MPLILKSLKRLYWRLMTGGKPMAANIRPKLRLTMHSTEIDRYEQYEAILVLSIVFAVFLVLIVNYVNYRQSNWHRMSLTCPRPI
jgi:hypothetical protein